MARGMALLFMTLAVSVMPGCPGMFGCVVEGTTIAVADGEKVVEELRVGDRVIGRLGDGSVGEARIVARRSVVKGSHLRLLLDSGKELRVTDEHPLHGERGFTPAGQIGVGDVLTGRGGHERVTQIERVRGAVRVWDLTVEPGGTFFASGVLVHNKSVMSPPTRATYVGDWVAIEDGALTYCVRVTPDGGLTLWHPPTVASRWVGALFKRTDEPHGYFEKNPSCVLRPEDGRDDGLPIVLKLRGWPPVLNATLDRVGVGQRTFLLVRRDAACSYGVSSAGTQP
jgi:hypothetical protein